MLNKKLNVLKSKEKYMFNVIEFSESVREYGRVSEYSEVKVFNDLIDIFNEYIDVEFVKSWFGKDSIVLSDVLEEKNGLYVMSVNEDMSLYIFKNESVCDMIEDIVFDLKMKVKSVDLK